MKKNLFIALSLLSASLAFAGTPTLTQAPQPEPIEEIANPLSVYVTGGLMHTDVDTVNIKGGDTQVTPSVLYGVTVGAAYKLMETENFTHEFSASIGWYTGNSRLTYTDSYSELINPTRRQHNIDVTAIPVMLSYNAVYALTDSLSVYAGVRTGAMIRKTDDDKFYSQVGYDDMNEHYKCESTEATPILGVGVGARAYITEKLSFQISYDFVYSIGDDCDFGHGDHPATNMSARYYGTISGGFVYTF